MSDDLAPRGPEHRELTDEEREALVASAFDCERQIKRAVQGAHIATWALAEALHEFHEGGYWSLLGYETLEEFLAQPDIGITRRHFFRLSKMWRDLVHTRQVDPEELKEIEPSKVNAVLPAVMKGTVDVDTALTDAKELGTRDLADRYKAANPTRAQLDPEEEPLRVKCPTCASWVDADELPEEMRPDGT